LKVAFRLARERLPLEIEVLKKRGSGHGHPAIVPAGALAILDAFAIKTRLRGLLRIV
jgi:hypothetical protein